MADNNDDLDLDVDVDAGAGGGNMGDNGGKPSLKEMWDNSPALKIAAVVLVLAVGMGGYMAFGAPAGENGKAIIRLNTDAGVKAPVPGQQELDPAYKKAVEDTNKKTAEIAAQTGGSALPTPTGSMKNTGLDVADTADKMKSDPLTQWRNAQEANGGGSKDGWDSNGGWGSGGKGGNAVSCPDPSSSWSDTGSSGNSAGLKRPPANKEDARRALEACKNANPPCTPEQLAYLQKMLEQCDDKGCPNIPPPAGMYSAAEIAAGKAEMIAKAAELEAQEAAKLAAEKAKAAAAWKNVVTDRPPANKAEAEAMLAACNNANPPCTPEQIAYLKKMLEKCDDKGCPKDIKAPANMFAKGPPTSKADAAAQLAACNNAEPPCTPEQIAYLKKMMEQCDDKGCPDIKPPAGMYDNSMSARKAKAEAEAEEAAKLAAEKAKIASEARAMSDTSSQAAIEAARAKAAAAKTPALGKTSPIGAGGANAAPDMPMVQQGNAAAMAAKQDPEATKRLSEQMRVIVAAQAPDKVEQKTTTGVVNPYKEMLAAQKAEVAAAKAAGTLTGGLTGAAGVMPGETCTGSACAAAEQIDQIAQKTIIPAGTIAYGQLLNQLNSDIQGPVLVQIMSGPFAGGRAIGKVEVKTEFADYLVLTFKTVVLDTVSYDINAIAMDEHTQLTGQVSSVDHHFMTRILLPAAAKFIEGYGSEMSKSGSSTSQTAGGGQATSTPKPNPKESLFKGIEESSKTLSDMVGKQADRPVTVHLDKGTTMGIFFIDSVSTSDAQQ